LEWYTKAADQGDLYGMFNLGNMHERGRGVKEINMVAARALYEKCAAAGHEGAQSALARLALREARAGNDEIAKGKAEKAVLEAMQAASDSGKFDRGGGNSLSSANIAATLAATKLSRTCDACGKTEAQANAEASKLRFCSICLLAKYCSEACRAAAEPAHEAACLEAHAAREGEAAGGEEGGSGAGPSSA
jgi:hypothetical protein